MWGRTVGETGDIKETIKNQTIPANCQENCQYHGQNGKLSIKKRHYDRKKLVNIMVKQQSRQYHDPKVKNKLAKMRTVQSIKQLSKHHITGADG